LRVSADVADEPLSGPVESQRDTAVVAFADMAAGFANHRGGKSPAVQKKDGLLTLLDSPLDRFAQRFGQNSASWIVAGGTPKIDHTHDGHAFVVHSLVESHESVFSGLGIVPTLERGGGAAEDDGGFFPTGAKDGHVAGIIAGGFVLLVGRLVLFIDDDHSGIFHWREN